MTTKPWKHELVVLVHCVLEYMWESIEVSPHCFDNLLGATTNSVKHLHYIKMVKDVYCCKNEVWKYNYWIIGLLHLVRKIDCRFIECCMKRLCHQWETKQQKTMHIVPGLSLFMELLLCINKHSFVKECDDLTRDSKEVETCHVLYFYVLELFSYLCVLTP